MGQLIFGDIAKIGQVVKGFSQTIQNGYSEI